MKKIIVSMMAFLLLILGFNTSVRAATLNSRRQIAWGDLINDRNMFCVQRHANLNSNPAAGKQMYELVSIVTIEGDKATDHNGNVIQNPFNARIGYILSQDEQINSSYLNSLEKNKDKWNYLKTLPVQNALWNNAATWMYNLGALLSGLDEDFVDNNEADAEKTTSWVDTKAKEEQEKYTNQDTITDNTNKNAVTVKSIVKDGVSYIKVGPFNWSFSTNLSNIAAIDQNGNDIKNILFSVPNGSSDKWVTASQINTGKDFHIYVPSNQGVTRITKLKGYSKRTVISVRLEFWKSDGNNYQNMIERRKNNPKEVKIEKEFPYNIPMLGNLQLIKVDKNNPNIKLPNVKFIFQQVSTGKYIKQESNGNISYVERNQATEFRTDYNGIIFIPNVVIGQYLAKELENPNYGYISSSNLISINVNTAGGTTTKTIINPKQTGNIELVKVNQDDETVTLDKVKFQFTYLSGPFAYRTIEDKEGNIRTEPWWIGRTVGPYETDANGRLQVQDLVQGTYKVTEVSNPHYGYEFTDEGTTVTVVGGTTNKKIRNKQKYVKLSGYVWLDGIDGKTSKGNNLFNTADANSSDTKDELVNGITVRLMDRTTGEVVQEQKTRRLNNYTESGHNGNGEYLFWDVLTDKLADYYIEFEYDGLTYTNVIPNLNQNRGSKAAEGSARDDFNKTFSVIEGASRTSGTRIDASGNRKNDIPYNLGNHEAVYPHKEPGETPRYAIKANTDAANYRIRNVFRWGMEEVKYNNLGICEREQPDMGLIKDLRSVKLTINGYEHTYKYAQRVENEAEYNREGGYFNVGVKFGSKYGGVSYKRAIYEADYTYKNEKDPSRELKAFVTYEIRIKNKSSSLTTKINSLVDYYDSKYKVVNVGTEITKNGDIKEGKELHYKENEDYNTNGYSKMTIDTNLILERSVGKDESKVYVQLQITEPIKNLVNDQNNKLENIVEINSYTIFDQAGKLYAGIDKNSNPGNCVPGDESTYEDDTDSGPDLKLEPTDAREMSGKVFLDETTRELKTGEIRQGNGKYDTNEKGIKGVKVELIEINENATTKTTETDENGDYLFAEYVPGDYILKYTWGDETYTVQAYKGTIYDKNRDQTNKRWWREGSEPNDVRWNDAMDNYDTRLEIDEEIKDLVHDTATTIHKMDSSTPTMGIGVEYETEYTASIGDKYVYRINNIDFGIVERAKQEIALNKRVKTLKATLTSGQVIANLTVEEDERGNRTLTGERTNITYMQPSQSTEPKNGFIRLELDNELIQGCVLEVGYEIKVDNISEVDYLSKNYYIYGIQEGNKMTIELTGIIDYTDNEWAFDKIKNPKWQVKTLNETKDLVDKPVYEDRNSTINEKIILYTEGLKGQFLEPEESTAIILNVSKILTSTDEIYLENEAETIHLYKREGGRAPTLSKPGNYIPGTGKTETDDSMAEVTIVTPSTGENRNYIAYISLTISMLGIFVVGIILIKKKVL